MIESRAKPVFSIIDADKPATEYLDGRPYRKMSPKATHAFVQGAFVVLLRDQGAGIGKCLPELHCQLGEVDGTRTIFVPDVAFIVKQRWEALAHRKRQEPPFAPDIAVEIRSPGESGRLRGRKIARYLATGATIVFDVDPALREIHVCDRKETRTIDRNGRFEDPRFPWLVFSAATIFADLDDL